MGARSGPWPRRPLTDAEDDPPFRDGVSELITTLAMEIGNTELADEFRQRVQKLL